MYELERIAIQAWEASPREVEAGRSESHKGLSRTALIDCDLYRGQGGMYETLHQNNKINKWKVMKSVLRQQRTHRQVQGTGDMPRTKTPLIISCYSWNKTSLDWQNFQCSILLCVCICFPLELMYTIQGLRASALALEKACGRY